MKNKRELKRRAQIQSVKAVLHRKPAFPPDISNHDRMVINQRRRDRNQNEIKGSSSKA